MKNFFAALALLALTTVASAQIFGTKPITAPGTVLPQFGQDATGSTKSVYVLDPATTTWIPWGNFTTPGDLWSPSALGNVFFGSGRPWVDVRSGANGCAAAIPGASDSQPAIQCQINYLNSTFGGGVLYFSLGNTNGNYSIFSGLTSKGNIIFRGSGYNVSNIIPQGDFTAITFDSSTVNSLFENMTIQGNTSSPTANLVSVANGVSVFFRNCSLVGGNWALQTGGVDGNVENCLIQGFGSSGGGILSSGANTYYNAKIDQNAASVKAAFRQVNFYLGGAAENRIINSDMSGNYTHSLEIADTSNTAVMSIVSTVLSSPISITGAGTTNIVASEIGSTLSAFGNISVTSSLGISGLVTVSGGTQSCAGNSNIVCPNSIPLISTNNLSDVASASVARANLGVTATGADATYAFRANNLSDLASGTVARGNLGMGSGVSTALGLSTNSAGGVFTSPLPTLTFGMHLAAGAANYNGTAIATLTSDATSSASASTLVARDGSANSSFNSISVSNGNVNGVALLSPSGVADGRIVEGAGGNVSYIAGNNASSTCYPNCYIGFTDTAITPVLQVTNGGASPTLATDHVDDSSTLAATSTSPGGSALAVAGGAGIVKNLIVGASVSTNELVITGSSPTMNTGSCTPSSPVGGATAGKFTAPVCAAGTIIFTAMPAAPNGYTCDMHDQTTTGDTLNQTANTSTSVTFTGTTANNDVVVWKCVAW